MVLFNNDIVIFENYLRNLKRPLSESSILTYKRIIALFQSQFTDLKSPKSYYEFLKRYTQKDYFEKSDFDDPNEKRHNLTHYYYGIKKYIEYKFEDPKLKKAILDALPFPKNNPNLRKTRYMTPATIKDLIENMMFEKHKLISYIMLYTGIRIGDCLKIRRDDITLETLNGRSIIKLNVIGKRNKQNICYISDPEIMNRIIEFKDSISASYGLGYMFIHVFSRQDHINPMKGFRGRLDKSNKVLILKNGLIDGYRKGDILDLNSISNMEDKDKHTMLEPLLMDGVAQYFHDIKADSLPNFYTLLGTNYTNYIRDLKTAMNKKGIPLKDFTPHSFRKCYARTIWDKTKDIQLLKKQLNHERVETTLRYLEHDGLSRKTSDVELQDQLFN
jgi:integrase